MKKTTKNPIKKELSIKKIKMFLMKIFLNVLGKIVGSISKP